MQSPFISANLIQKQMAVHLSYCPQIGNLRTTSTRTGPTRDDVVAWAKNEVKIETEKYKKEKEAQTVLIPFHADRQLDYDKQLFFRGGYLFLQSFYYQLQMNKICRKLKQK